MYPANNLILQVRSGEPDRSDGHVDRARMPYTNIVILLLIITSYFKWHNDTLSLQAVAES